MRNPNILANRLKDILDNPHLLQFYSKEGCGQCLGRGYRSHSTRHKDSTTWTTGKTVCPCVKKAVSKEIKELDQTDG